MAAKDSARGKSLELRVGRIFGGRRRRNGEGTGFDDCVNADGFQLPISIECKSYSMLQLRSDWVTQAIRNSLGRPWILVQKPKGHRQILATLPLDTLIDPNFHALLQQLTSSTEGLVVPGEVTNHPEEGTNGSRNAEEGARE